MAYEARERKLPGEREYELGNPYLETAPPNPLLRTGTEIV